MKREFPQHSTLVFVENVIRIDHGPEAEELPSSDGEFVEKWNGMPRGDRIHQCLIERIEFLIASTAAACVVESVLRVAVEVRIARIDPAKVGEQ